MVQKKIAIYSGTIPSTVFIENLIKTVASEELKVYLFGTGIRKQKYDNPNIHQFISPPGGLKLLFFTLIQIIYSILISPKRFVKLIRTKKGKLEWKEWIHWLSKTLPVINNLPNVFHVQWAKSASDWIFLKDLFGVKMVLSLRGAHINYSPVCDPNLALEYKKTFPQYDSFHAVSKAIAKEAEIYGAEASKIKVIYSGVDLDLIDHVKSGLNFDQQIGSSVNKKINLISVGRLHWIKGYTYSIDACKILKDARLNFSYTIVAEGNCQEFMYQIEDLGLQDFMKIIPGLPHSETLEYIAKSDILILPSLKEGLANVLLEAIALGTYVISTDSGGLSEIIDDSNVARIIPRYNSQAIAEAIKEFQIKPVKNMDGKNFDRIRNLTMVSEEMGRMYESIYTGI